MQYSKVQVKALSAYSHSIDPDLPSRRFGFALFCTQATSCDRKESSQVACELSKSSSKPGTRHSGGGKIYRYEIPNHVLTMGAYPNTKMMTIPTGSTYFM